MSPLEALAMAGGILVVLVTLLSAVRTIVLPHGRSSILTRMLFLVLRRIVEVARSVPGGRSRDHEIFSLYAPIGLVLLPMLWIASALIGFTAIFWSLDVGGWWEAFKFAGSAMLTIGFADTDDPGLLIVTFLGAALTISVLALLLVTYLPSMYQAYSARETAMTELATFAGEPADAVELILRHHRIGALDRLTALFTDWQGHFFVLRETHTALPFVALFRSSTPKRHWVASAEALLDAAALWNAVCERERQDPEASLCLRAGYLALADVADFFRLDRSVDPAPDDPISVSRETFDEMVERLDADGVSLMPDLDQAWRDWAGWRVNYDTSVTSLRRLTAVPEPM